MLSISNYRERKRQPTTYKGMGGSRRGPTGAIDLALSLRRGGEEVGQSGAAYKLLRSNIKNVAENKIIFKLQYR